MATATQELTTARFFHDFMKNRLAIAGLSRVFAGHDGAKGQQIRRRL
jgi:hypothetical protein